MGKAGRPRVTEPSERDAAILAALASGSTLAAAGAVYGLTRARMGQIAERWGGQLGGPVRALHIAEYRLWLGQDRLIALYARNRNCVVCRERILRSWGHKQVLTCSPECARESATTIKYRYDNDPGFKSVQKLYWARWTWRNRGRCKNADIRRAARLLGKPEPPCKYPLMGIAQQRRRAAEKGK